MLRGAVCKHSCRICATFRDTPSREFCSGAPQRAPDAGLKISPGIYSTVGNSRESHQMFSRPVLYIHNAGIFLCARCSRSSDAAPPPPRFDAEMYARHASFALLLSTIYSSWLIVSERKTRLSPLLGLDRNFSRERRLDFIPRFVALPLCFDEALCTNRFSLLDLPYLCDSGCIYFFIFFCFFFYLQMRHIIVFLLVT